MPAPAGPEAPTAVMVTVCWLAGAPMVTLSPTAKPLPPRTLMLVAPSPVLAMRKARVVCVPTCATVTVSMPWPTLSMSSLILSPTEMLATEVTLMLVEPAGASAPSRAWVPGFPTEVTVATSNRSWVLATAGWRAP